MKGDFSRLTFDPDKHYTGVLHQQGRVWLDSDWNEDVASREYHDRQQLVDLVGPSGAPRGDAGFTIRESPGDADPYNLRISSGRYYAGGLTCDLAHPAMIPVMLDQQDLHLLHVTGWRLSRPPLAKNQWVELCDRNERGHTQTARITVADEKAQTVKLSAPLETQLRSATALSLRQIVTYETQADYPMPPQIGMNEDEDELHALVYLEAWQRFVSYLEDPGLLELALGGQDTAARSQTVAQVKVMPLREQNRSETQNPWRLLPPDGAAH
jgi:hypothetical protein